MALGISVLWSTSPLFYRAVGDTPTVEIVFYRSFFLTVGVAFFVWLRYRSSIISRIRAIGMPGSVAALCLSLSSVCYVAAVDRTTIAAIAFTYGSTPFFTAALAWVVLGERVSRLTWVAMSIAAVGIGLMVAEGFALGTLEGNILAVGSAVASAGFVVSLRYGRSVDQVPAVMVSGIIGMAFMSPFVADFSLPLRDLGFIAFQGLCISAFCNSVFTWCAKVVPAAELTLFSLLEIVLSPIGAWLIFAEVPTKWTVIGGGVLLLAVFSHAIVSTVSIGSLRVKS